MSSRLRQVLAGDKVAWGIFADMTDPAVVEIAGYAGYDFAIVDMEHSSLDLQTVENMLRAAAAVGISSIVRVPDLNPKSILRVVELGPDGILVPHVKDAADAKRVVEAARYQPLGDRGISNVTRACRYGKLGGDFDAYAAQINQDQIVIVMIEEVSAVEDIEQILAVAGLDGCLFGPADLARSMGIVSSVNHPRMIAAIERVSMAVRAAGKQLWMAGNHPNYFQKHSTLISHGARMITIGCTGRMMLAICDQELERAKLEAEIPK